jgi:hypothetical protein
MLEKTLYFNTGDGFVNQKTGLKFDLPKLYKSEILPWGKANPLTIRNECIGCCPEYLGIKKLEEILEDGLCDCCKKEKRVFNLYVAKQVIARFGYGTTYYIKMKDIFLKDMKK